MVQKSHKAPHLEDTMKRTAATLATAALLGTGAIAAASPAQAHTLTCNHAKIHAHPDRSLVVLVGEQHKNGSHVHTYALYGPRASETETPRLVRTWTRTCLR